MTASADGLVSVVIVTHQSASTIARCIQSVRTSACPVEIIVVDNASDDGTCDVLDGLIERVGDFSASGLVADTESNVTVLVNADNLGFARACNQGAAAATGNAVLFLNPDAFVGERAIGMLDRHLRSDARIGLIGCRVVDESGRPHGPQRRREPTWRRSLMSITGLSRLERRWPVLDGVEVAFDPNDDGTEPRAIVEHVDAVNGAVMMLPRKTFNDIGGFDGAFTLHAEDLDLCRRVRDAGMHVALANDVEVVHIGGVSSRRRPLWVEWQKTRSLWRYFRKHQSEAGPAICVAAAAGLAVRLILKAPGLIRSVLRQQKTDR